MAGNSSRTMLSISWAYLMRLGMRRHIVIAATPADPRGEIPLHRVQSLGSEKLLGEVLVRIF